MKNPDNNPLRIVYKDDATRLQRLKCIDFSDMLTRLAIAEATLVKAGKQSALPHFIAIVKELEEIWGFRFEQMPPSDGIVDTEPTSPVENYPLGCDHPTT
jgi:hypothetical protein